MHTLVDKAGPQHSCPLDPPACNSCKLAGGQDRPPLQLAVSLGSMQLLQAHGCVGQTPIMAGCAASVMLLLLAWWQARQASGQLVVVPNGVQLLWVHYLVGQAPSAAGCEAPQHATPAGTADCVAQWYTTAVDMLVGVACPQD